MEDIKYPPDCRNCGKEFESGVSARIRLSGKTNRSFGIFYVSRTFEFGRFEIVPLFHILRYGYSLTDELNAMGYGILPEGRFAVRF